MDKILLKGMMFEASHGVLEFEKKNPQVFIVDLELFLNLSSATISDSIEDTVDYSKVYEIVAKILIEESYNLIEKIAGEICNNLLEKFISVDTVKVLVKKPYAPINGDFEYMGVELVRKRNEE